MSDQMGIVESYFELSHVFPVCRQHYVLATFWLEKYILRT